MHVNNFFVCGPKFTVFFRPMWERLWLINYFIPIFDLWIRFGDIRDQIRKLSEIAPNFGRFLPSQILGGRPSKNRTHFITHGSPHVVWIKICDDIPVSPEVIDVHALNYKPNFKFSRLNFFEGTPFPVGVCARQP